MTKGIVRDIVNKGFDEYDLVVLLEIAIQGLNNQDIYTAVTEKITPPDNYLEELKQKVNGVTALTMLKLVSKMGNKVD